MNEAVFPESWMFRLIAVMIFISSRKAVQYALQSLKCKSCPISLMCVNAFSKLLNVELKTILVNFDGIR